MKRLSIICVAVAVWVGCSKPSANMSTNTAKELNAATFNVAKLPTVAFNAPDMMCPEGCGEKVKEILSEQPGAKEVVIDFDNKTAIVAVEDGAKFDSNAAVAALADHGFKNSTVKGGDEAASPAAGASNPTPSAPAEQPKGDTAS